jgi:hypothetical protein
MTDRRLQNSYLVTGMQLLQAYNDVMRLPVNQTSDDPAIPPPRGAGPPRGLTRVIPINRVRRTGLVAVALFGIGLGAAACSDGPSSPGVASVGKTTTTNGSSTAHIGSNASLENAVLAYVACMRTHGEPNMPDLTVNGSGVHISASAGSGFDPNTPQYTVANNRCQHLLPQKGRAPSGSTITPADQAYYLKAVACMRSHGFPGFPDPVFQNNGVTFNAPTSSIDTNSPQYKSALATCEKLIPSGLPYSPSGS